MSVSKEVTRRSALIGAAAIAGAGIAELQPRAASAATTTALAGPGVPMSNSPMSNSPSIYDYGGAGNGSDDFAAITACLAAEGSCYLPFYRPNTTTEATYYFSQAVVLTQGMSVVGESRQRKSRVRQAAGQNLFIIRGNNTGLSDLLIDASLTTASAKGQATILLDTASQTTGAQRLQNVRIDGIQWGMDRDFLTLCNGWDFMTDNGGPGSVVDMRVLDVDVWGAKGRPFDFTRLFAFVWLDHVTVDWTRQSQTPTVPGIRVDGGQGIVCQDFAIQGWGNTGTGNNLQNGFDFSNGAAIQFIRTRADGLGGVGYKLVNLDSVEMVAPIGSQCADHQYLIDNCLRVIADAPYAEGRRGLPGSVAVKHGVVVKGCTNQVITAARATNCTGSGLLVENSTGILFTGFQAVGNQLYGWEELGTSNRNGLSGGVFAGNVSGSGRTGPSGSASFVDGTMRQSGSMANGYVPGAAVTW